MERVFELRGAARRFGDVVALQRTDLAVAAGRTTVLIGPSGCGKSTLLRLLIGLLEPDAGQVLFEGTPVVRGNALLLRRRMGYVIQEGGLFPHLDARANIGVMARWLGMEAPRREERIRELCQLTRFPTAALERYPAELSGGQRQRVSLMRALMLDPDALLLDEPLGALDPMIRAELQSELRDIFRQLGKSVVLVTHDLGEAAWFADTLILMQGGRVVQAGALEELARTPAEPFVEEFLRAQSRNHAALERRLK